MANTIYWVLLALAVLIALVAASAMPRLTGSPDPEPAVRHLSATPE